MSLSRKIIIASGKGGVGKTTVAVNLGRALARKALRVVIVDLDFSLNNLDVLAGVEDRIIFDVTDCVNNRCRVKQALLVDKRNPSLSVLPADTKGRRAQISVEGLARTVETLSQTFDYCLFDCPAGLGEDFDLAVACAEEVILVCTPHVTSLRDVNKVVNRLGKRMENSRYVVVNRYVHSLAKSGKLLSYEEIFSLLPDVKPLGVVLEQECLNCLEWDENSVEQFSVLADNLHNGKCRLPSTGKRKI